MAASQTDSADAADLRAETQSAAPDKRYVLPKPQHFSEVDSFQYLLSLIKAGKHREVRAYLIEILPELAACKLHEHEKFNQLFFIPRLIQKSGMTKHGVQRLLRKVRVVERNITGIELPKGGAFADFGCGPHDPVAMATYFTPTALPGSMPSISSRRATKFFRPFPCTICWPTCRCSHGAIAGRTSSRTRSWNAFAYSTPQRLNGEISDAVWRRRRQHMLRTCRHLSVVDRT